MQGKYPSVGRSPVGEGSDHHSGFYLIGFSIWYTFIAPGHTLVLSYRILEGNDRIVSPVHAECRQSGMASAAGRGFLLAQNMWSFGQNLRSRHTKRTFKMFFAIV